MSFYSSILSGVNSRLGYNADEPDRVDTPVNRKLTFKAQPKKHIDLEMSKTDECATNDDGTQKITEKTASKLKINHGDCTTTFGFANDKMSFDAKGKVFDQDGWKSNIGGAAEVKQAKKEWKVTGTVDFVSPDLGGAKLAGTTKVEYNQKEETLLKQTINMEVSKDLNLGVSANWDTKKFTEIWAQATYKLSDNKNSFSFARFDHTRNLVSAGCDQKLKDTIHHSFEAIFGWKDYKGIMGHPIALRGGVEYELSDKTKVTASGSWDSNYTVSQEVEHEIDNHWTVSATQSFDSANVGTKKSPYHIGFAASYKL